MRETIEVECVHLEDELIRVRFANSQLVSDHPAQFGGTDTGPAPGDIVLMALTSASALAGRSFASEHDLDVSHVGARTSLTTVREGFPPELRHVPLPHLTYVERFWRLLEIEGRLSDDERDAMIEAMAENRVTRTIRNGMELDETLVRIGPRGGNRPAAKSAAVEHPLKNRKPMPPGETAVVAAPDQWRVAAAALDDQTCLVKAAGAMSVAGGRVGAGRGATPEELLLAGVASCTTIFLARNAAFRDIPVEAIRVRIRAELPDDPGQPIVRAEKVAEVTGDFSGRQLADLENLAEFCAFGETLRRGTPIADTLSFARAPAAGKGLPSTSSLDRVFPAPGDPAFCSDASCCVPEIAEQRS